MQRDTLWSATGLPSTLPKSLSSKTLAWKSQSLLLKIKPMAGHFPNIYVCNLIPLLTIKFLVCSSVFKMCYLCKTVRAKQIENTGALILTVQKEGRLYLLSFLIAFTLEAV